MTEISRSEAIKVLEKSWSYENEINHAHYKAISDMEKLEKIEEILFDYNCNGQECATCNYYEINDHCIKEREVDLCRKILRGGENEII